MVDRRTADNIIIHLHYIRLGDDTNRVLCLVFSRRSWTGADRFLFALFFLGIVFLGFDCNCHARSIGTSRKQTHTHTLTPIDHVKVSINSHSSCTAISFSTTFSSHKRRVFCTIGLSRSLLCASCISPLLSLLLSLVAMSACMILCEMKSLKKDGNAYNKRACIS